MAQPPGMTAGGAQLYVGPSSPPLNPQKASNDFEGGAQPFVGPHLQQVNPQDTSNISNILGREARQVLAPHLQPVDLQHSSNILQEIEPFVGPNSQPINLQDIHEEGGAQPFVSANLQASNLQVTNSIIQGGGAQPFAGLDLQPHIQGGSNAPFTTTAASATQAPQVNLTGQDRNYYRPLYLAAQRGDWKTAKSFIDRDPNALTARITDNLRTVLLVAAQSCRWEFVLKLLKLLSPESIAMRDVDGFTALHYVAQAGDLKTAKALVEKNADLLHMVTYTGLMPLHYSIFTENKELVWFFSSKRNIQSHSVPMIVNYLNRAGFLDLSLYFIRKYPELSLHQDTDLLSSLASMPSCFLSGSSLGFFARCIYKFFPVNMEEIPGSIEGFPALQPRSFVARAFQLLKRLLWKVIAQLAPSVKVVRDMKLKHECAVELLCGACAQLSSMSSRQIIDFIQDPNSSIMATAVENGIEEIVSTLLQYFPELIDCQVIPERNILQAAIENRQENIFNIIKEISPIAAKNLCRVPLEDGSTTLHLAGKLAPASKLLSIFGAALQLQRELMWFKEVEKITAPYLREQKNGNGLTAKTVFWERHIDLAVEGEKWMKDTANFSMVVSTLIATVLFAAAFTVPGGNINDKGTPVFLWTNTFMLFAISDAIGLFSSLASLLIMFLTILTARQAFDDFLESLPKKLIIGLGFLFLAIAAMIVAFGTTLTIILSERWHWVFVPITLLASFPLAIFLRLQLPFFQILRSTYGSIFHP